MALSDDARFRRVHDYAIDIGFPAGLPTFREADYGKGPVGGVHFLKPQAVQWRDVPAADLGNPQLWDIPALFRAAADYAGRNGFAGAYPNCHQATHQGRQMFGINLIPQGAAVWRDVPRGELGNPRHEDVPAMMRAADSFASRNGFVAGFPTFHRATYATGPVCGLVLFPQSSTEFRDVYIGDLEPEERKVLVVLGQFRNPDGTLIPETRNRQWYKDYVFGRNRDSLSDFYRIATNFRLSVVGRVYGWFDIGHTTTEHEAFKDFGRRKAAYDWTIEAARRNGVPVDEYRHRFVIVNRATDFGGVNPMEVLVHHAAPNADPNYTHKIHSYIEHEFGHAIGLGHTMGPGGEYDDPFCIMSFAVHQPSHKRTIGGITAEAGSGLNIVYVSNFGGMPAHRRIDLVPTRNPQGFYIAALGYPELQVPQAIKIPNDGVSNEFWISFRHPSRWDKGVNDPIVILHEVRPGDTRSWFTPGQTSNALRAPGDEMTTPDNRYRIELRGFTPGMPLANVSVQRQ